MKKKLFTLLLCAFAWIGVSAYTVTPNSDGSVTINGGSWVEEEVTDSHGDKHTQVSAGVDEDDNGNSVTAGLPNSFTADEKALINNATKLILTGYIDNMLAFQETSNDNKTSVDMSEAHFQQNLSSVKEVTYNKYDTSSSTGTTSVTKIYMSNVMSFQKFPNITEAKLSKYVESLWAETFKENGKKDETTGEYTGLTTTFEIPEKVKYIDTHVVLTTPISYIVIPANVEYINTEAFMNASIAALIDVTVEGYTAAANSAFDYMVTVGQTNSDYQKYANLHFPEGAEKFFTNTSHPLTQKESLSKKAFQEWLTKHKDYVGVNGWQQFISAGSGKPTPPPTGKKVVLKTFSDNVARLVPINFRAYIVNGATKNTNDDNYTVKLQQIFAIPANTGVILYGEINENSTGYTLGRIPSWDDTPENRAAGTYVAPYDRNGEQITGVDQVGSVWTTNYMVPAVKQTKIYPFYKNATMWDTTTWPFAESDMKSYVTGSSVTDRNFILSNLKNTSLKNKQDADYVGLFRVISGTPVGPNQAYLSLPATMFKNAEGAEALVVKPTAPPAHASEVFRSDEWNDSYTDTGNWGQRGNIGVLKAKFAVFGLYDEDATAIKEVNAGAVVEDGYYTLQGVKVVQPQKGVYVKNGKKVIIK